MIRSATSDDLTRLVEIDRRCFTRPWSATAWADEIAAGGVFVMGDPVCGYACAPITADICELRRIAVDSSVRRRGFARDLLVAIIEHARRHSCERIWLEVAAHNHGAVSLYAAHGFVVVGRRPGYYRDPVDDALSMDLPLHSNGV